MTGNAAPRLRIELEKRTDGDVIFRCIRADGSTTWQRHTGARGVFFVYHDLTHLAVERTLRLQNGFFGLMAAGWDIADTQGKSPRGPLPDEAIAIENLVGLFDRERGAGTEWTADEFNSAAEDYALQRGVAMPIRLTDSEIAGTRNEIQSLHASWRATPEGELFRQIFE
ncbi:MAG: hypothetical protein ABIW79_00710 [Gemmatimonas sp.]